MSELPVVVIGAGPQGLAVAAHLTDRGNDVIVVERGAGPAAAVSEWGHVRLFSGWPELTDTAARRLLEPTGWTAPPSGYPTGAEWVDQYLAPLAQALGERVRYSTTVTGVSRKGRDRLVDSGRNAQPFVVHTLDAGGEDGRISARAVVDASGTWSLPNPAGADGLPAVGEKRAASQISYRIPQEVSGYAGQHLVVIGSGHSAAHAALRLSELVRRRPDTTVTWLMRRRTTAHVAGGAADELPERAALGSRAQKVVASGLVGVVTGFRVAEFRHEEGALTIAAENREQVTGVSQVFALTGFRPDVSILSELRLSLDASLEAVAGIAAEIDPNIHSCGSVGATGARELIQPEEGFFIVGAKSYGRAPTFLALTGFEQARSVAAHLAGDEEAAESRQLVLPDTGVCGGSGDFDAGTGGSCCAAPVLQLGVARERLGAAHERIELSASHTDQPVSLTDSTLTGSHS
ncbi:FAD-dependent oxidoreductase [Microbacterium sp. MYb62]|uniref:FAD-dependent oxidoreductase n=1 Tax=Microbacterium sp. MYb62 TaxID=1848690 RepID=UPI000CFD18DC|nr:FAD-dependent oxidoreductase [Microbacterium sp. MYb62]PRB15165.1 flavoprotein [Microbacterium sp. MYb62]